MAPIKTCNYCGSAGEMPTFADGETICYECLSSVPVNGRQMRVMIFGLRADLSVEQSLRAAAEGEVERLKGIVTAMEEGCVSCQYPKRVEELTCQKNAGHQVIAERDVEIERLRSLLSESRRLIEDSKELAAIEAAYEQGRESMRGEAAKIPAEMLANEDDTDGLDIMDILEIVQARISAIPTKEPK